MYTIICYSKSIEVLPGFFIRDGAAVSERVDGFGDFMNGGGGPSARKRLSYLD